ncbi:tRNA (N(6)-L-threonylcarbamoyladenosine(37)-C(2))-methylthiotransferase MtaB [Shumkonia mesophila]|uniref:tRNA (N(6)-L-threonylcarbamoyladenosine(37)-C(2))- methylthiotransferase MtaB n=1 Tax=Shumkonia mesophila TaxID=2838854 RepID=UPI0029344017|nr:tRNA (N(6)-L-threonylcarbamoyladenosine(37)-C(2))-methylthiotransferase MtaB [Shumkonia mesophila]
MAPPKIVTLGCRLNAFESEVIRERALAAGISNTVIVNTCAVTAEAERQARQTIRRLRREHPGARIVVTGCAAQLGAAKFAAMPEVDQVVGNAEKLDAANLAEGAGRIRVTDIMTIRETAGHLIDTPLISDFGERTRAFVQIQQGCDHRCTFCIIPFARGPNRSVPPERIVEQVRALTARGYAEAVLTGVDICSYGADLPEGPKLGDAVAAILAEVPELKRLRLSSLDPAAMDDTLFALLAGEPRLMPHLHLSLQAADDLVLKRMKRRHSRAGAISVCQRARAARPDVVIGADLIAGFPTEDEAMFANTLSAVADMGLTFLHVFPFSARAGTPAARMPQVPGEVRRERAARLREAGDAALAAYLASQVGGTAEVLVESGDEGHTPHYARVRLAGAAPAGAVVEVRLAEARGDHLLGVPLS